MPTRKCPVCGVMVKLENLERHVANVHPGRTAPLLSTEERQALARSVPRRPARHRTKRLGVGLAATLLLVAGLAFGLPYLNLPNPHGGGAMHLHPRLAITVDGHPVGIPAYIGINPGLWNDHSLDEYGMMGSMAPLHTHDASGTIHVESRVTRDYTIGEFFRIWGQSFDDRQALGHAASSGHAVWMVVDASERPPSPSLVLRDGMEIHIVCGVR